MAARANNPPHNDESEDPPPPETRTNPSSSVEIHDSRRPRGRKVTGVTLKMAFDQQGGVAEGRVSSQQTPPLSGRFTCSESLDMVHRLRRESDAVLVGRATVEADDCTLTVRRVPPRIQESTGDIVQPVRVVLDPTRKLLPHCDKYQIFTDGLPTIIYYVRPSSSESNNHHHDPPHPPQVHVETMDRYPNVQWIGLTPVRDDEGLSIPHILDDLATQRNLSHIMVEGGPATARMFLQDRRVDRAIFVYAPLTFEMPIPSQLSRIDFEQAGLEPIHHSSLGVDHVEYWSRPSLPWPANDNGLEERGDMESYWP